MARRAAALFLLLLLTVLSLNGGISQATYGFPSGSHHRGEPRPALEWALANTTDVRALPVYHVTNGWVGPVEAWMKARAFGLGLTDGLHWDIDGELGGSYYGFHQVHADFTTSFREGEWSYGDLGVMEGADFDGPRAEFPSDQEALFIAQGFLREKGLAPHDLGAAAASVDHEGAAKIGRCGEGADCEEIVLGLPVVYERRLQSLPTFGPGGTLRVSLDASGDIVEVEYSWTPLQRGHDEPFVPLEEGMRRAESTDALVDGMFGCSAARMTEQRIAYFVPGATQDADWAFPVYEFAGVCTEARGERLDGLVGTSIIVRVPAV